MASPVVYKGIKFPFQKGASSFPAASSDEDLVRESLLQLVLTMNGERIMRPEFGSNALSFVFENNDDVLNNLLQAEIRGLVARFEPRIQVLDIGVTRRSSQIILTISYIVLSTRKTGRATVPISVPVGP